MSWLLRKGPSLTGILIFFLLVIGIAQVIAVEISQEVPGGLTVRSVRTGPPPPLKERADIDGNGIIEFADLMAVAEKLGATPADDLEENVNQDDSVDIVDLAIVASYLDQEV